MFPAGGTFFACSGFLPGAAGSRECRLVENDTASGALPSHQVACRLPFPGRPSLAAWRRVFLTAFTRCVPGRFPGPLHSAGTGRFAGATLGACPEMAVPVGCRAAYRSLAVADSVRSGGKPAVAARRLWALRSARCRVTEGPAARCESTRSRSMRARMCERRLTRPSSMTMRSASARASGFLPWSFPRRARAAALPTSRLARPRCSGQPSQPAAPAAVTRRRAVAPGRRVGQPDVRRIAELLTRVGQEVLVADALSAVRDHPARGPSGWCRAGAPRLPVGRATARPALPGIPGALDAPPRSWPDTSAGLGAAVRARAPRL